MASTVSVTYPTLFFIKSSSFSQSNPSLEPAFCPKDGDLSGPHSLTSTSKPLTTTHLTSLLRQRRQSLIKQARRNHRHHQRFVSFKDLDLVSQVLSLRDKNSDIRILRFCSHLSFSCLNGLIRRAIRQNVHELDIDVATDDYFNLPRCVITSESLRTLRLKSRSPGFRLPPSSVVSGLQQIKIGCRALVDVTLERCLQLHGLDVSGAKLERLRVASSLDAYCGKSWVKINAPKLKSLCWEFNAITCSSCLENLTSLHDASIGFIVHEELTMAKLRSVSNFLLGLSHVHCLTLESQCIEFFHCFPSQQWNRDLWDMYSSEEEQYWQSQTLTLKSFLENLNVVEIHGFLECENEVSLAKFFLKHGKALQEMTLCTGHCNYRDSLRRQKIRSQMMGFSRASSNAKISFH
ncbi:hypothetical protein LWI28_000084 [Acer negundo]|uniref:FBD domain-containing protein n=1 Tax=Acer negundo TaxID=4023 RepID=A0AAD5IRZ7_ACENE|nr:hypothetical protein LWI28_000084 [Acer negundo]